MVVVNLLYKGNRRERASLALMATATRSFLCDDFGAPWPDENLTYPVEVISI
jgi:hypothetical protein